MINKQISKKISVFHGRVAPDNATIVGYGAILDTYNLKVPLPDKLSVIGTPKGDYDKTAWKIFSSKYNPENTLYKHLVFSLKYEGVNLLILKKLFEKLSVEDARNLFQIAPLSKYSRRLWFLYEWLLDEKLPIPDLKTGNNVKVVDEQLQFGLSNGKRSPRHRVINNLPGTKNFCPLVSKTKKLVNYLNSGLQWKNAAFLSKFNKNILYRTSAFLLLKDSKASFSIEGEIPKSKRAAKWANVIGQAGINKLTKKELLRLQQLVIENSKFVKMGFRENGGFVGIHDRYSGQPIPDHISARWQDLEILIDGLLSTGEKLINSDFDPVLSAGIIAYGFVFIHPFEDGNGRIHRYLVHHILAQKGFTKQGIIFPVSASMLEHITQYRNSLEHFSSPLLDFVEWNETKDYNIEVTNETIDYYRYFDATKQVEFLYDCVKDTIENIIPKEIEFLLNYDKFKSFLEDEFEMPDKTVALLTSFLEQNNGKLSRRKVEKEFSVLSKAEINMIEKEFKKIFLD